MACYRKKKNESATKVALKARISTKISENRTARRNGSDFAGPGAQKCTKRPKNPPNKKRVVKKLTEKEKQKKTCFPSAFRRPCKKKKENRVFRQLSEGHEKKKRVFSVNFQKATRKKKCFPSTFRRPCKKTKKHVFSVNFQNAWRKKQKKNGRLPPRPPPSGRRCPVVDTSRRDLEAASSRPVTS